MKSGQWTVQVAVTAVSDLKQISAWSRDNFGAAQARIYTNSLKAAIAELAVGPEAIGVHPRPDIGKNIWTMRVARSNRQSRHCIIFRLDRAKMVVDVLRLLHENMDLARHLTLVV